jgi:fatty acid desaturase
MDHKDFLASLPDQTRQELLETSNWHGLRHALIHFGAIACVGTMIAIKAPLWPLLLPLQGVLIIFLFTLAHEATHQTPFTSSWLNTFFGRLSGVFLLLPFSWFCAFHMAHHRWTNIPGKDPELASNPIKSRRDWLWHISGVPTWIAQLRVLLRLCLGREDPDYLGARMKRSAEREARMMFALYGLIALFSSVNPILIWVWIVPALLGQPFLRLYLLAEHGDCPYTSDMFANTRTIFTSRLIRFLAWNMPYHTEHHVCPQVPFHQLPRLHMKMRAYLKVTADGYADFTRQYLGRL